MDFLVDFWQIIVAILEKYTKFAPQLLPDTPKDNGNKGTS